MRSHRVLVMAFFPLVAVGGSALAFAGCSERAERVDTASAKLVTTSNTALIRPFGNAPSATVTTDNIVVGYRDESGLTTMGWAYGHDLSTDGGLDLAFNKCNAANPSCGGGIALPCNLWSGGVCMAPGQKAWMGTPSLVADGRDNVVYVTLGDGDANTMNGAELVVATLSTGGGAHFGVTPAATVVVNTAGCESGIQDLPDATIDFTTEPPTLWVVWRHKGASSFGGCVNHAIIDGGTIQFGAPTPISGMDREFFGNLDAGQGGLRIQAGDGAVTVAFSNNDQIEMCPKPTHMQWGTVTSFDNGASWTSHSIIFHTSTFPSCVLNKSVWNTLRGFDFLRAPDGNYYAAVQDDNDTVRVFYSSQLGVGVPIPAFGAPIIPHVWRELCFAKPKSSSYWTDIGEKCPKAAFAALVGKTVLYPTLAADGDSRVSLLILESTKGEQLVFPTYRGIVAPRSPRPIVSTQVLSVPTPPVAGYGGPITPYLSMIARPPANAGAVLGRQSCFMAEPFFPFWIEPDGIVTRRVELTPP